MTKSENKILKDIEHNYINYICQIGTIESILECKRGKGKRITKKDIKLLEPTLSNMTKDREILKNLLYKRNG